MPTVELKFRGDGGPDIKRKKERRKGLDNDPLERVKRELTEPVAKAIRQKRQLTIIYRDIKFDIERVFDIDFGDFRKIVINDAIANIGRDLAMAITKVKPVAVKKKR